MQSRRHLAMVWDARGLISFRKSKIGEAEFEIAGLTDQLGIDAPKTPLFCYWHRCMHTERRTCKPWMQIPNELIEPLALSLSLSAER